jgi:hypothetical protein
MHNLVPLHVFDSGKQDINFHFETGMQPVKIILVANINAG